MSSTTATIGLRLKEKVVGSSTVGLCAVTTGKVAKKYSSWLKY